MNIGDGVPASQSMRYLHKKDLLTLTVQCFIALHFLCIHFWQLVHCIEFLPTPLLQISHGHPPVFCISCSFFHYHNLGFIDIYFHTFPLHSVLLSIKLCN